MGEAQGSGRTAGMRHPMRACMQHVQGQTPSSHVEHDVRAIPGAEHSCEDEDFSESTLIACVRVDPWLSGFVGVFTHRPNPVPPEDSAAAADSARQATWSLAETLPFICTAPDNWFTGTHGLCNREWFVCLIARMTVGGLGMDWTAPSSFAAR